MADNENPMEKLKQNIAAAHEQLEADLKDKDPAAQSFYSFFKKELGDARMSMGLPPIRGDELSSRHMRIKFNTVLRQFGVDPCTVLLIRHTESKRFDNLYDVWKQGGILFSRFLTNRGNGDRTKLTGRPNWAHFVRDPYGETLFISLVKARYLGPSSVEDPSRYDLYRVDKYQDFSDLEGKMVIEWGSGRTYLQ